MSIAASLPHVHRAELVWPFGVHKGTPVCRLPLDYVHWYLSQPAGSASLKRLLRRTFDIDLPDDGGDARPDPQSAPVRFPLICWKWEQQMVPVFGDDPKTPEGAVVAHGRSLLRKLCSEVTGRPFPPEETEVKA